MKRNLLMGIVLISAVALSSCSSTNKLAGTKNTDDDVYFTKAKSGDQIEYADVDNYQQNNYNPDNDYYYYGDYASRINRFNYLSPFDYDDDFYYGYASYPSYSELSSTSNKNVNTPDYSVNSRSPIYNFGLEYSPFDYGYSDFGGYDDYGYGVGYSSFVYSGGRSGRHSKQYFRSGKSTGGNTSNPPLTFHRGAGVTNPSSNTVYYPGRPGNSNTGGRTSIVNGSNPNSFTRAIRPASDNPRPSVQQVERAAPSQNTSNTSSSSSSGSSSSGGGGRPVRP